MASLNVGMPLQLCSGMDDEPTIGNHLRSKMLIVEGTIGHKKGVYIILLLGYGLGC